MKITRVYVSVRKVGVHFGCVGQVRSARTGRVLWEVEGMPRPYGMGSVALQDARETVNRSPRHVLTYKTHYRES